MTDDRTDVPGRLGYDLGAESDDEARDFEDVASRLGLVADPVTPPPALKADLFARLASTPQLPPADTAAQTMDASTPVTPAPAANAATPEPAAPGPAEAAARRRWFSRPIAILAAAAAAVVLFVGGAFVGSALSGSDSFQQQQASALASINAAPDAQRASAPVSGGGTATLVWSGDLGKSALVATDLPPLPNGKTYELWYMRDGQAIPAGTLNPAGSGSTWRVLAGNMTAGDAVGVTVEPKGGSSKPTSPPIVAINS